MGKKSKASRRAKGTAESAAAHPADCAAAAGPSRVLLLRHGQSEAQSTKTDVRDAPLSDLGRVQAAAWRGKIGALGAEAVLVSPLLRALETALLAFDGDGAPIEVCRHARELWWDDAQNALSHPEALEPKLRALPRGDDVCGLEAALAGGADEPSTEDGSVEALREALRGRAEATVCVVCHWGVINALCGASAENAMVVECRRSPVSGHMSATRHHTPPNAPTTL